MITESCTYLIRSKYHTFSEKERIIADYILADPGKSVHPSIEHLAKTIGISEATLVRFVKKLGYKGYQRFRIALATEAVSPSSRLYETPIGDDEDDVSVVFNSAISTLNRSKEQLDRTLLAEAADLIASSKKLLLFGLGGSNIVALDGFHKCIRTGINCVTAEDYHMQLMLASQADADCCALLISHSGTNMDSLAIADELKQAGCPIIVLTSQSASALARTARIVLSVEAYASPSVSEAFSARIAHLLVIDTLYVEIMKRLGTSGLASLDAMRKTIATRKI